MILILARRPQPCPFRGAVDLNGPAVRLDAGGAPPIALAETEQPDVTSSIESYAGRPVN